MTAATLDCAGMRTGRVVVDARPPRAEYRLTSEVRRLTRVVEALVRFASGRPTDVR